MLCSMRQSRLPWKLKQFLNVTLVFVKGHSKTVLKIFQPLRWHDYISFGPPTNSPTFFCQCSFWMTSGQSERVSKNNSIMVISNSTVSWPWSGQGKLVSISFCCSQKKVLTNLPYPIMAWISVFVGPNDGFQMKWYLSIIVVLMSFQNWEQYSIDEVIF